MSQNNPYHNSSLSYFLILSSSMAFLISFLENCNEKPLKIGSWVEATKVMLLKECGIVPENLL